MATAPTKLMTAEEFWDFVHLPENSDKLFELDRGEVIEMSLPGKRHGFVCANVVRILGNYAAKRKKGYVCSNDTGVVVKRNPDSVRGPDVLFFEDASAMEDIDRKFGKKPARLAVEVLSPNDSISQVNRRINDQLRFGTPMVWLLDPETKMVTVYRTGKFHVLEASDELTGDDVLPGFACNVAEFFALPGQ